MYWTGKRYMLFQIAIYSQNLQFSFHAAVAYSESFQTCEMELFAGKINGFPLLTGLAKSSRSDVLQGSKYTSFQLTININNIYGRDEPQQNIMASQISVFNAWWTLETTSTTESNDLQSYHFHLIRHILSLKVSCCFILIIWYMYFCRKF